MSSPRSQVEFVTRLTYNLEGLPGRLKLYFSQFLSFHFSDQLSPDQIQHVENKMAARPFESDNEILDAVRDFSLDEKVWVVAALLILKSESEAIDDRVFSVKLNATIQKITTLLDLTQEHDKILLEKQKLEDEALRFQNRKLIRVPLSVRILAVDYVLRWVVLIFFGYAHELTAGLLGFNFLVIPIVMTFLGNIVGNRNRARNARLLETYVGEGNFRIEYYLTTSQYTWLAFFIGSGVFIAYLLPEGLHWFALVGLSLYYIISVRFFSVGRINENDLVRQLAQDEQKLTTLNRDENDEVIVSLETKLNSLTGRLEAYVLESALFGALTFSGFLQIMSSELVTFEALEHFVKSIFDASRAMMYFDGPAFWTAAASLDNKVSLFCLVSVESLLCSVFFLAVIGSRLRFSDVADRVRTSINLAKAFNEKEEALHDKEDFSEKRSERLVILNARVNGQLQATVEAMREADPIMTYMQYFRNAGIVVFLVILLSSTLFVTSVVGWAFLLLVFATYLYFNRKSIGQFLSIAYLGIRIQFSRQSFWFLGAAFIPFVLASILRDWLHWGGGDALMALGHMTIGLYIFVWLTLAAHVDDEFGEIEVEKNERRLNRWKLAKNILAVLLLAYCAATAMKSLHMTGANMVMMISLNFLGLILYFVGYYLAKIRWLGVVAGGVLATFVIGILFKTLHLQGANEMLSIGALTLTFAIPILIWQRKKFHILFLKLYLAAFLISVTFHTAIFRRYAIAASHRTWHVERIMNVIDNELEDDLARSMQKSDWYIYEYGAKAGFEAVYAELMSQYRDYCWETVGDSTTRQQALLVARQSNKIQALFGYNPNLIKPVDVGMEADILVKMNRKEEALRSLEMIMKENPPEKVREIVSRKMKGLMAG